MGSLKFHIQYTLRVAHNVTRTSDYRKENVLQYNQYFQLATGSAEVKKAVKKYMDTPAHQIHGESLFFYLTAYSLSITK